MSVEDIWSFKSFVDDGFSLNFLQAYLDAAIDEWHSVPENFQELWEYLGLTHREYKIYLEQGLEQLVESIKYDKSRQK